MRFPTSVLATLGAAALFAACGGDDEGGGGGQPAADQGPRIEAKAVDPNSANNASGEVTYCIGGSLDGHRQVIRDFNRESNVTARLIALPESADVHRQQQIQRLRA